MHVALSLTPVESSTLRDTDHFNLRTDPKAMERIAAAVLYPPLRGLLSNLNNSESLFSTFGSKIWDNMEEGAEEPFVFASRIDLVFLREDANFGTGPHRTLAERLAELLGKEPGEAVRAELQLRRAEMGGQSGFCLRISLLARGKTTEQSRLRWGLGLARLQQALLFVARELRHELGAAD